MAKETADLRDYLDGAPPPSREPFQLAKPRSQHSGANGATGISEGAAGQPGGQDRRVAVAIEWLQSAKERLKSVGATTQAKPRAEDVLSAIVDAGAKPQPPSDNLRALFVRAMCEDKPDWSEADAQYAYGRALADMQQRAREKLGSLDNRQQRKAAKDAIRRSLGRSSPSAPATPKPPPPQTRVLADRLTPAQRSYFQQAVAGAIRDTSLPEMLAPRLVQASDSPKLPATEERALFAKKEARQAEALEKLKLQRERRDARAADSMMRVEAESSKRGGK